MAGTLTPQAGPPWLARRVGDRLLCGRPTPVSGGCRGEIAFIGRYDDAPIGEDGRDVGPGSATLPQLEDGMTEEPYGSHFWRVSKRAKDLRARGQKVGLPVRLRPGEGRGTRSWRTTPDLPFQRACPVCNVVAEVTTDLL